MVSSVARVEMVDRRLACGELDHLLDSSLFQF
jgi:hypothetical protein